MYQGLQRFGTAGQQFADRSGFVADDGDLQRLPVVFVLLERMNPRQQLIEDVAKREDIGLLAGLVAFQLLRSEVGGRSDDAAGLRDVGISIGPQGDAEVHDLHVVVGQQHDVFGLHVAMHDALGMGVGQSLGDLRHDADLVQQAERHASLNDLLEGAPFQKLHHQVGMALVLAAGVDGDDVFVPQRGRRADFQLEALE